MRSSCRRRCESLGHQAGWRRSDPESQRKYVFSVLKLLFYQHGLRRLDLKARDPHEFWKKNLLVLVGDEFQDVVTSSVGGMSDYTVSGKIREANVALIALTQSYLSLLPPHANKDQANVLVLNLRNRMIFRAADEQCAKQSAEFSDSLIRSFLTGD